MVRVQIDGEERCFQPGLTVLDALRSLGLDLPHLCHDDRIRPAGVCRLCVVEIDGALRPTPSCTTALVDGMSVRTNTAELQNARRGALRMLAHEYPAAAVTASPEKPLHQAFLKFGMTGELQGTVDESRRDDSHPYIRVEMSQCIECYRCVRICEELQGQFVWHVQGRDEHVRIVPDSGVSLLESTCVSCGACVDACPSGALEDRSVVERGAPTGWTRTVCPYCGVGCELNVGTKAGRITSIRPVMDAPVNKGHLCSKGRYAFDFLRSDDRVTRPMLRRQGKLEPVSWDEAVSFVAGELRRIVDRYGADATGVLGSARATNEENYVAQKFARLVLGTNNVDCCARVCHAPSAAALRTMLGTGAATNSFDDVEAARTLLLCGSNATENHPIVGARIKQAALRGATLIVIDPRRIELADYATLHLQPRPGSNIAVLNAMAATVLEEGLADEAFLRERVDGLNEFRAFVSAWTPERAAASSGVDPGLIREAARLYARTRPAMSLHGLGTTEHEQGTEGVMCLINLALLTGNIGVPGSGVNPLRGQNNVQGSAHMGCEPEHLTGYVPLEQGREAFERAWGAPLPRTRGLNLMEMLEQAEAGKFKALWAIGYDVLLTNPDAEVTRRALSQLELLIVQDLFLNETARELATVFLPAAASFEKDGTFMNSERRVQRVRRAVAAPGECRTDHDILCAVAKEMGRPEGFTFDDAEQIWNEVRSLWKAGAGISWERLEAGGLQWPCPSEDHPGTRILHQHGFTGGPKATLRCIELRGSSEAPDGEYPLALITGRTLHQFNAGTMTGRTPSTVLRPTDTLDISPDDCARLGLSDGDPVRLISRHGETQLPVRLDPRVPSGVLFASFQTPSAFVNRVTGPARDGWTDTPQYKLTAVRVERV